MSQIAPSMYLLGAKSEGTNHMELCTALLLWSPFKGY